VVHSKIINSLVEDVIMPIVGLLTGGVDFTQKFIALDGGHYDTLDAAKEWDCRYHLW
jgi:large conductance mechanosensitive channel